jgi:hypothetical protein
MMPRFIIENEAKNREKELMELIEKDEQDKAPSNILEQMDTENPEN